LPRAHTPPRHARIPAVTCPSCQADQAYFVEVQTRSADEPATLFYKCVDCGHRWKEG
jgi:DNA-directed RNA polymerase III subunit RPC11